MKYRRTVAAFEALLLLFLVEFIDGQNVVLHVDSCYEVGADMTITAEYTGSDTFSNVEWFYSDQTSNNIVIITSTCTVLGSIGAGFPTPVSRISFQCPSTGLPQHNYTLTVEGVTEAELTNKKWGAKFVLDSSPEEQDEKNVTICPPTTTSTTTTPTTTALSFTSTSTTIAHTSRPPTSTSTTSAQTSTSSSLKSVITTHIIPTTSSRVSRTTSATSSTEKVKYLSTTPSVDSSSSETVVIIVVSVVGGLFVVGIVITIILMLLSQRKRRKHVSKGTHTHEENKNTWQYQKSKSPSSLGHLNHGYRFIGKSSGHRFRQNPHFVRQPNRPVTYQYQPWNGNCRQNRYIYPGLSGGKQYRSGYVVQDRSVVQDRRVNKAPNDYNAGNLRQQYYSHPHNPQRSYVRNPNRETLHTDDQNYVAADYSIYW